MSKVYFIPSLVLDIKRHKEISCTVKREEGLYVYPCMPINMLGRPMCIQMYVVLLALGIATTPSSSHFPIINQRTLFLILGLFQD